jgi:hypothetical protein
METYEEIAETRETAWNWLVADPNRMNSIGTTIGYVSVFR